MAGGRLWRAARGLDCHQDSGAFRKGSDGLNCLQAPSVSRFSFPRAAFSKLLQICHEY
jgi:hypothetical protein